LAKSVDGYLKKNGISSPGSRVLGGLFDAIYFASLKTEEGKSPQLRAVLLNPKNPDPRVAQPLNFRVAHASGF
jgi:hypothetical protein